MNLYLQKFWMILAMKQRK